MNRILALFAFVILAGFLGILAYRVPSPDLLVVLGLTILLAGYDFATSSRDKKD
ncbi:hypothetical protein [Loktanella sp. M215]|uniref:hypothetical protein n=1 Tax=Loktanella sp. M215 TaxID=2675431 RepID=UPI001F48B85B|nr:hypothetical protein [Loktanella sp. M215]MBU2357608.1 hypothetical protein [Alphaproteobacteria bacterium]